MNRGVNGDVTRRIALSFPEAVEKETWGHPTFRVRDSSRETFSIPAYVGHHGWVAINLARVDDEELADDGTQARGEGVRRALMLNRRTARC